LRKKKSAEEEDREHDNINFFEEHFPLFIIYDFKAHVNE
jgi:hypothetical protein